MMLPPSRTLAHTLSQRRSRTAPETEPTYTPALGSNIHLESSPRSDGGADSTISTTITRRLRNCVRPRRFRPDPTVRLGEPAPHQSLYRRAPPAHRIVLQY